MGSEHLSTREAASHLKVSLRTIYNWVQRGLLSRNEEGKIPLDELERVEEARQEAADLDTRYELVNLRYRVEKLEKQVSLLMTLHETDRSPLRMPEASSAELADTARNMLENPHSWDVTLCPSWAKLLDQMDKVTFELCGEGSWSLFYNLCLSMMKRVTDHPDFEHTLDLQLLHAHLNRARLNLRTEALLHLSETGKVPVETRRGPYGTLSTPKEDLLAHLASN